MINFKQWLLTEEIWQGNVATVYHRTKPESIPSILTNSWQTEEGCMYGCGLYTTFAIESQFTNWMEQYGTSIIKFKVTNLDQYIICHKSVAQQILGQNYKISDQLKKHNLTDLYTPEKIKNFDEMMETVKFSSAIAKKMFESNKNLQQAVKGIIYYGENDGYCLVKYPPVEDGTITLLGYADDVPIYDMQKMRELESNCKKNEQGKCESPWITSTDKIAIKSLYGSKIENKYKYLDAKSFENVINQSFAPYQIMAASGSDAVNNLTDLFTLFKNAKNKDEIAKGIFAFKNNLTAQDIILSLGFVSNLKKVSKFISQNDLNKLEGTQVFDLIKRSKNPDEIAKFLGPENLNKLTSEDISKFSAFEDDKIISIIKHAGTLSEKVINAIASLPDPQKMGGMGIDNYILKIIKHLPTLTPLSIANMLGSAYDKNQIADALGEDNINKLTDDQVLTLITNPKQARELEPILQKYGRI